MAAEFKATYKRFNGIDWDTFYFTTTSAQVAEVGNRKWLTDVQQTNLNNYLVPADFNKPNKLLQLNSSGQIPVGMIPGGLDYLPLAGGTLTGNLLMSGFSLLDANTLASKAGSDLLLKRGSATKITVGDLITTFANELNMSSKKITALADPIAGTDAANRQFVEQLVAQGTHVVGAARVATTANITALSGHVTIDGVVLVEGDRVLVKNQTNTAENGMYLVNGAAVTWTRLPLDSDKGSLVFVLNGATNKGKQFQAGANNVWELFFVQDTYYATVNGGLELDKTGFGFGIKKSGVTNAMLEGSIGNDKLLDIEQTKITAFAAVDTGTQTAADASKSILNHFSNIYAMIKGIKGETTAHAANANTLLSLKSAVDLKNRTFTGTAAPTNTGYVTGDVYLHQG